MADIFQPDSKYVIAALQSELEQTRARVLYLGACLQQTQAEANATIEMLQQRLDLLSGNPDKKEENVD